MSGDFDEHAPTVAETPIANIKLDAIFMLGFLSHLAPARHRQSSGGPRRVALGTPE
jgi:hypothetical protein